jgi:hypothetical protein
MGKRSRRRNAKKISQGRSAETTNDVKFFFTSMEPCYTEQNTEPVRVMKQVKDCINEIYTEHINDLEQRKQKRLACKIPTDFFNPYNLVVNSAYQQKIKTQIQELKKNQYDLIFKESLLSSTDIFINYLKKHVNDFDGKKGLLQVIILYEAYHTLQNSITQIGGIVEEITPRSMFEISLKKKFYSKVASEYFELIDMVSKKENSEYIEDVLRMKVELENISKTNENDKQLCIEYCPTLYSETCSDEDVTSEALHNLPIDELVKIITQDQKKSRKKNSRKSRLSTKDNSTSPYRELADIDKEIEDFKQRLEKEQPVSIKFQPSLSEEFLAKLRQQLKLNRVIR